MRDCGSTPAWRSTSAIRTDPMGAGDGRTCQRPAVTPEPRWRRPMQQELPKGHRQVKLEGDREASKLARAANLCGSPDASDLAPDREGLRADGSVLDGWEVIAVEMEEVVEPALAGWTPS